MKKFHKLLAAALLLAVVISAFGIFSAFAEDTSTAALAPTVTLDLDNISKTTISVANSQTITREDGSQVPGLTMTKQTDAETGEKYWLLQSNALAGEQHGSGAYLNYNNGTAGVNPSYSFGNAGTSSKQAVDFFVIDMDISTDTEFMPSFYLHSRFKGTGGNVQDKTAYPGFFGDDLNDVYVDMATSKKVAYPVVPSNDEWMNITFVYDFRGNDYSAWKMYAYIDGYFVGEYVATVSKSTNIAYESTFIRPSIPNVAESDYESIKFRNWTYTNFPAGWAGDLAGTNMLGRYGVPLTEIDELAYCLEGTNAERGPIATVTHADGTETVCKTFDDLDCNFLDGDTVTLNRNVGTPILVNASNVTFADNGYSYNLVDTSKVDFTTAKYIVQKRSDRSVVTSGDAEAFATYELTNGYVVQLLDDLTWTRENGSKGNYAYARQFTYELNGHTLTLASEKRHYNTTDGSNGVVTYKNGKLVFAGPGDLTMLNANNAFVFYNLKPLAIDTTATFMDQRHGLVLFKNSDIEMNAAGELASSKANGLRHSMIEFIGCNVTQTVTGKNAESAMIIGSNYASSGIRSGGTNLVVNFTDTNVSWGRTIFTFDAYCNQDSVYIDDDGTVHSTSEYADNAFDVDFNIKNSDIVLKQGYYLADVGIASLTYNLATETNDYNQNGTTGEKITLPADNLYKADGMMFDFDMIFEDSSFKGTDLVRRRHGTEVPSSTIAWTNDINVVVSGDSYIDAASGVMYDLSSAVDAGHVSNLAIGEGTKLANSVIERVGNKNITTTTLADGAGQIAHTNTNGDYGFIVTANYNTYNYKLGNLAAVPFYWNDAEGEVVNINKVVTLASSAAYTYSWNDVVDNTYTTKLSPAFKPQVNLTTNGTIALNMYIPEEVYEVITMDNIAVSTEYETVYELDAVIGETEYAKLSIKGIAPKDAETVVATVALTVKGAYEDEVVGEWDLSVVDYCAKALASDATTDAEKQYVLAILNYISAVYTVEGKTADAADALLAGAEFDAVALGTEKYDSIEGISAAALNLGSSINWVFKVEEGFEDEVFTFTYYVNGEQINVSRKADANGEISIGLRAYDALKDVVVNGSTVNLAGYAASDAASDANVQAAIAALAIYANEAAIYNNVALGND